MKKSATADSVFRSNQSRWLGQWKFVMISLIGLSLILKPLLIGIEWELSWSFLDVPVIVS